MKRYKQLFFSYAGQFLSANSVVGFFNKNIVQYSWSPDSKVIKLILTVLLIGYYGSVYASEVSLNSSVNPDKSSVGQPLTYTLTISGIDPGSIKITLPEKKIVFPDTKDGKTENKKNEKKSSDEKSSEEIVPLYIINNATRDESEINGVKQTSIKIFLTYYRVGTYTLPEIKISGNDGVTVGYKIPSVVIEETNKEGTLEDIEPPVSLSGNYTRIIVIVVVLVILLVSAFFLYRYIKKRKKTEIVVDESLPPIEIFLNEVESLKLRELIQAGKINEYVFDISIIFRRFLSAMLMFDAAEMTTDEIAKKIKKYMPADLYSVFGEEIISNMRLWDFSKFAEFAPSSELLLQNLDATISAAKRISRTEEKAEKSEMTGGENGTVRI